eukprot:COSAG06_NODE_1991_length_7895_cov_3.685736_8_plen_99_part_00
MQSHNCRGHDDRGTASGGGYSGFHVKLNRSRFLREKVVEEVKNAKHSDHNTEQQKQLRVGSAVCATGLQGAPELNGRVGVAEAVDDATRRFRGEKGPK